MWSKRQLLIKAKFSGSFEWPLYTGWTVNVQFKVFLFFFRNFMAELCRFIDSGTVTDLHNLLGASHLLATIVKCRKINFAVRYKKYYESFIALKLDINIL